jgi:hypothetical protein
MAPKSTLGIQKKVSALQDPDKMMVYHMLHCLTQATSEADGSVTSCQGAVSTRFQNRDNTVASLQAAGTELSVNIQLYMDSRNSLPAGGR